MPATQGCSWWRRIKAHPREARGLRAWAVARLDHENAVHLLHELYLTVLAAAPAVVDITLSTAGPHIRVTAVGHTPVPRPWGVAGRIVDALAADHGHTADGDGLWARLDRPAPERTESHD